jgi:hypothetical protein
MFAPTGNAVYRRLFSTIKSALCGVFNALVDIEEKVKSRALDPTPCFGASFRSSGENSGEITWCASA